MPLFLSLMIYLVWSHQKYWDLIFKFSKFQNLDEDIHISSSKFQNLDEDMCTAEEHI